MTKMKRPKLQPIEEQDREAVTTEISLFPCEAVPPAMKAQLEIELGFPYESVRKKWGFDPYTMLPQFCSAGVIRKTAHAVPGVKNERPRALLVELVMRISNRINHEAGCQCRSALAILLQPQEEFVLCP